MNKFKAGDTVKILKGELQGEIGRVILFNCNAIEFPYVVLFGKNINKINPSGIIRKEIELAGYDYRKCYIFDSHELQLVEGKKTENVKSLLKSGDLVIFGSGEKAKVFLDYETDYYSKGILAYIDKCSCMVLKSYNEDLFTSTKLERYAINKIYRPKHICSVMSKNLNDYDLIWERKEVKEMTMKEICEALGYEVKIKKEDK